MHTFHRTPALDWLPERTAPAELHDAARLHALTHALPVFDDSWRARLVAGRGPLLYVDFNRHSVWRTWLARRAPHTETHGAGALVLLDAPAGPVMILLVEILDLPVVWCIFDLTIDDERAMAVVLLREQRIDLRAGRAATAGAQQPMQLSITMVSLPDTERQIQILPESHRPIEYGVPVVIPPAVARCITVPATQPPQRIVFAENTRVRFVMYVALDGLGSGPEAATRGHPTYNTVTSDMRGSLEEARMQPGWHGLRLVNLRYQDLGTAVVTTEIVITYRGDPAGCWSSLAAALRTVTKPIPVNWLVTGCFLARSAVLDDAARHAWFPSSGTLGDTLNRTLARLPLPQSILTRLEEAIALWDDARQAATAAQAMLSADAETNQLLGLYAISGCWHRTPPTPHAANPTLSVLQLALIAVWQHIGRAFHHAGPSATARAWIGEPLHEVWSHVRNESPAPAKAPVAHIAREAGEALVREIDPDWSGSFGIDIAPGFTALRALGIEEIWYDRAPRATTGWVRLVPQQGRGGLVMPWIPAHTPEDAWQLVLYWDAALELHLLLLAAIRDACRIGIEQVIVRSQRLQEPFEHHVAASPSRGRRVIALPHGRTTVLRPSAPLPQPAVRGQYVDTNERAEITRHVAELHGVRAHLYHFSAEHPRQARADVVALWAQLSDAEKLLYFRTTQLPPHTTIRGVRQLSDGRWSFQYQRGQYEPDRVPKRIIAQGALLAASALKLIREAQDEKTVSS